MNKLKELNEKLGSIRKQLNKFTNDRAEKMDQFIALGEKDELTDEEKSKFENLESEIDGIDAKMSAKQSLVDNLQQQITQERINGDNPANESGDNFKFHDTGSEPSGLDKDLGKFSLTKAIRDSINHGKPQGFEAEIVQDGMDEMKSIGKNAEGNIVLPTNLLHSRNPVNALTSTGGTDGDKGGKTIQTDVGSLIDILRSKLPFVDSAPGAGDGLGATFWDDLSGNITFPKAEEEAAELTERTENQAAQELDPTFDSVDLSPKRRAGFAEISRQLILQSSFSVEQWLRNYIMYKLTKSINVDVITYLLNLSGTYAVENGADGGELTWAKIVEFETGIAAADAEEEERFGMLTNANVRGKLKTTEMAANTAQFIWDKDSNEVNNMPGFVSSLVPNDLTKANGTDLSAAIAANWASLYIGMWGPIDMLANPFSKDTEGLIRLNIWSFTDKVARRPESFAVSKDIVTTP